MGVEEILGSMNNLVKIENDHESEIKKIISTDNDNKRKREIEELSLKLNHQLKEEELQCLCQRYKNMHIEEMIKKKNEHEENEAKIYNDYLIKTEKNKMKFKKEIGIIKNEENKNFQVHLENMEKIKSEKQNNSDLHKERITEIKEKNKNKSKEIDCYYKDLKDQRDLEALKVNKNFENDKITIEKNSEIAMKNNQNKFEENKQINENNFLLKKEQLKKENDIQMRKLDILEKMLSNPNPIMMNPMMMNPMMMNPMMLNQMMMSQMSMQNQIKTKQTEEQKENSPGPLPVVKDYKNSMNQNPMNFNPMTYSNMFNPMLFSQMMDVK